MTTTLVDSDAAQSVMHRPAADPLARSADCDTARNSFDVMETRLFTARMKPKVVKLSACHILLVIAVLMLLSRCA